jgi:hypothetical protein
VGGVELSEYDSRHFISPRPFYILSGEFLNYADRTQCESRYSCGQTWIPTGDYREK